MATTTDLDNGGVLATSGTGSFGQRIARTVLELHDPPKVIMYSRDALKQFDMQPAEPFASHHKHMRRFVNEIRDEQRP